MSQHTKDLLGFFKIIIIFSFFSSKKKEVSNKELSKDTKDKAADLLEAGVGNRTAGKQLAEKTTVVREIVRKWRKLKRTISLRQTGAPCMIWPGGVLMIMS